MISKPEEVEDILYVEKSDEFVIWCDDYGFVLNKNSVAGDYQHLGWVSNSETVPYQTRSVSWSELDTGMREKIVDVVDFDTTDKGSRNEREVVNILGQVRGSGNVEKVDAFSNHDPFGLIDVLAVGDGEPILVQVKTNSVSEKEFSRYRRRMRRLDFSCVRFEIWVRIDYQGWVIYRYNPDKEDFELFIEMDTTDTSETVETYREKVGFYD